MEFLSPESYLLLAICWHLWPSALLLCSPVLRSNASLSMRNTLVRSIWRRMVEFYFIFKRNLLLFLVCWILRGVLSSSFHFGITSSSEIIFTFMLAVCFIRIRWSLFENEMNAAKMSMENKRKTANQTHTTRMKKRWRT